MTARRTPAARNRVLMADTSIRLRTCWVCGVTSRDVPIFSAGDQWLCGPINCGAVRDTDVNIRIDLSAVTDEAGQ